MARSKALLILLLLTAPVASAQSDPTRLADEASLPEWAQTGRIRLADLYGGPIETAKGVLSGWPYFFDADPEVMYATTNRYDPKNVDLLEHARINWAAVVWSAGFSNRSERVQRDLLRPFIAECHSRGIRVMAYLSIANIFAEDTAKYMPESRDWPMEKDGKPVPYGSADYRKVGRVTRYMADLRKSAWREEILRRALAAVDAGVDGLNFDNNAPGLYGPELMGQFKARVLAEGRKRNPYLLVCSNYHGRDYLLARYENGVNTEDGIEPGIFPADTRGDETFQEAHNQIPGVPVKDGRLILNVGLLRILYAVSEGRRPVVVHYSRQRVGTPMTDVLPPAHQQRILAECQAFHGTYENFNDGKTYRDLFFKEQKAVENWDAIGCYNAFFEKNEALYTSPVSLARVAVIIKPQSEMADLPFLNALAARNVIYDVVYEQDAAPATLSRYAVIIGAPSVTLRPGWRRYEAVPPAEIEAASPARITAPDSVIVNVHGQANTKHVIVHLLNYGDTPVSGIEVTVRGHFERGLLLSPDKVNTELQIRPAGEFTRILIPELNMYNLLVL